MSKPRTIGFVGAGKLGTPVALAIELSGHDVTVYDVNPAVGEAIRNRHWPFQENQVRRLLQYTKLRVAQSIQQIVAEADIIFCAVQTPHEPRFEGTEPLGEEREDFDYRYLEMAVAEIAAEAKDAQRKITLSVISTCLPGTYQKRIKPLLNEYVDYVYTPLFIAMGTVIEDFLHPEFNLIGVEGEEAADQLGRFFTAINGAPNLQTDITTAEGIKVSYNTWITAKTVLANAWGELAYKTGMNFNDLLKAWSLSTKRILSPRYMDSGMGDGGGCHPRDNIAMSYIAQQVGMSRDIWTDLMQAREAHAKWLAKMVDDHAFVSELPVTILGRSFKPETNIETGSPALLVANFLNCEHQHLEDQVILDPAIYLIATKHDRYKDYEFPAGSTVIDPFRYIPDRIGVNVIRIGDGQPR